tara:strand:- start:925 stop:1353 length:429 start_codon:yes stop_codon:yes gene_type:complete
MAYIFLTEEDFEADIQSRLLEANSTAGASYTLEKIEKRQIDYITSKLSGRYDMETVFAEEDDDRNGVILQILMNLVLYKFLRRNAARKITDDIRTDYEWALKELDKLESGNAYAGLPSRKDEEGEVKPRVIYGNNKNPNNYL